MKSLPPMNHCKICFKIIKNDDICRLINKDICLCHACSKLLEPKFIKFKANSYNALAIYDYSDFIKNQIYLYKGCFDIEMKNIFLNMFIKELRVIYRGYYLIPIPSYKPDDDIRGFNHVTEVFKMLNLPMLDILEKTSHFKQAENNAKDRQLISKYLVIKNLNSLIKKRVLIVDDIYTTGSTMSAAINLVEKLNPKEIRVLVLAKTKEKKDKKTNTNISLH